jgi:hypothetical protein
VYPDLLASRPGTRWQWIRLVGNAVNLSTPLGLAVAAVGRCRLRAGPRGLWLADGYRPPFPTAGAFTVGNVIITGRPDWAGYLEHAPTTLAHEERHTWQWLALGPAFLPAYTVTMGWSWLRTGDRAAANAFEQHAGLATGGYPVGVPRRSVASGVRALVSLVQGRTRAAGRTGRADAPTADDAGA